MKLIAKIPAKARIQEVFAPDKMVSLLVYLIFHETNEIATMCNKGHNKHFFCRNDIE